MVVQRQRIIPRHYQRLAFYIYHFCILLVAATVTATCSLLYTAGTVSYTHLTLPTNREV